MSERTKEEPVEVIHEIMDLRPFMVLEFGMAEKDGKSVKGALLRVSSPEKNGPEDDLFTAPEVTYLFETAARMLTRLAKMSRRRKQNQLAFDMIDLGSVINDLFARESDATPRKES